jgi:hypothetical protein
MLFLQNVEVKLKVKAKAVVEMKEEK